MTEKKLPKLPYGEGTFFYHVNSIGYRKRIKCSNGSYKNKTVYGKTTKECMKKMREYEKECNKHQFDNNHKILYDAMLEWFVYIKQPTLKSQSATRLESTIRNQIGNADIGHFQYRQISSNEIQSLINQLNACNYSYSTIKKTYDALNDFYRYVTVKDRFDNPMTLVVMPTISNVKSETKTTEFFEKDDINKFIEECSAKYNTGSYKYRYGYALAANIYLGMRMGEYLALQWKDIDFEKNTIYISKTLIEEVNPEYDKNSPDLMTEQGIHKVRFVIQQSTKKSKNRYIPINTKAKELLLKHKDISEYIEENDYVISTRNGKTSTIKNMSDCIKKIEKAAETKVQSSGTHILRHTCASLYFRAGVPVETICQILGNTREVCEKTYVHFIEEQLQNAAHKISSQINDINV